MPPSWLNSANVLAKQGRRLFGLSLHDKTVEEPIVLVDTTVQEKMITSPTDTKLAKGEGILQRRTFVKEVKALRLACRHFRHVRAVKRRKPCGGYEPLLASCYAN